eukprot:TRINITY_DN3926_c2_g1_i3.p1 TRINITY_DN3926_c2_g1~~TRINITY_DN3926_c2_g1_i3.p1  ORF type:complete len:791 (-),score=272.50 TRINITY_DN3926_c2_g1_i3:270-2642(-)
MSISYWKRLANSRLENIMLADRKAILAMMEKHNDEILYLQEVVIVTTGSPPSRERSNSSVTQRERSYSTNSPPKNLSKRALIAIGRHRVYCLSIGLKKPLMDDHFLDIIKIHGPLPNQVTISTRRNEIMIETTPADCIDMVGKLFGAFDRLYPEQSASFPFSYYDQNRLEVIKGYTVVYDEVACDGYTEAYKSYCDYLSITPCQDICWDIENLYNYNDVRRFDLNDLALRTEKLSTMDYKAMMMTLQNNEWFTELSQDGKIDKEIVDSIVSVFSFNKTLTSFNLKNSGLTRDTWSDIRNIWTSNEHLALKKIDFSGNPMDEKSAGALANCFTGMNTGLEILNLNGCQVSTVGSRLILTSLGNHLPTLKSLSISTCRLDRDASLVLGTMLADPECILKYLDISDTSPDFSVFPSGKSLRKLVLAGIKMEHRSWVDFAEFSKKMPNLKHLDLSRSFPVGTILSTVLANLNRLVFLDLSENSLGDLGLKKLISILREIQHPSLRKLALNRNFESKGEQFRMVLTDLANLINSEDCKIEKLWMQGGHKKRIRRNLISFIIDLLMMRNARLKYLDISGNKAGNLLGTALGKAIQTNSSLKSLLWDGNKVKISGFTQFRNGLALNSTLTFCPENSVDISFNLKHDPKEKQKFFLVLQEIQKKVHKNYKIQMKSQDQVEKEDFQVETPILARVSTTSNFKDIDTVTAQRIFDEIPPDSPEDSQSSSRTISEKNSMENLKEISRKNSKSSESSKSPENSMGNFREHSSQKKQKKFVRDATHRAHVIQHWTDRSERFSS